MTGKIDSYPFSINTRVFYTPVILHNDKMYRYVDFSNEEDMRRVLMRFKGFLKMIFGGNTIYIPVERLIEGKGVRGIPDAFLLILNKDKLDIWLVEFELIKHGVKSHITPQIERFNKIFDTLDPDKVSLKIYDELNRMKKVRYIKELLFGERGIHRDLIPVIKDALMRSRNNILLIMNRVNDDLVNYILKSRRERNVGFEVMIMQLYTSGEEDILLISPFTESIAASKPLEYSDISKRRMDKYWLTIYRFLSKYGLTYKRRKRKKKDYIIFYYNDSPFLVMWKAIKKGLVYIRMDSKLFTDSMIRENKLSKPKKCRSFCKSISDLRVWDSYIEFNSMLITLDELLNILDKVLRRISTLKSMDKTKSED